MPVALRTNRPRYVRFLAVVLGFALTATAFTSAQAVARDPGKEITSGTIDQGPVPGGFATWEELLKVQDALVKAAERITRAAQAEAGAGFAGVELKSEQRELHVYWKGNVSQTVDSLIAGLRKDVRISVLPARHSEAELAAETRRLAAKTSGELTSITAQVDGSGLVVTTASENLAKANAAVAGAKVAVTVETGVSPKLAVRWNDSPPWWGGAAWRNSATGGGCSTGFAVRVGTVTGIATAGHCGALGQVATDPTGEVIGPFAGDNDSQDSAWIRTNAAGRVYNNPTPATSPEFSNPVIGPLSSFVGLWICTSGAYSGTRCGIQVRQVSVAIWVGYWINNTVRAEKVDLTNAIGQGDSGGTVEVVDPVSSPAYPVPASRVHVAGVNTAIDTSTAVPCTGYVLTGRTCAWRMYYAPWKNFLKYAGITVIPG
ncbi:hypothetical protein [Sinosporangium siamense]|uniref:Streptogrisin C n=1 Tax=Sinosporangium siamense TaxID=1367973 RepID=A0A919RMY5_9ACTN|nr:hypothetical protein [Sinosporangium siamense]GII96741.1 hypothetical protein Ssi02_69720 [Sinosporangium siamense]